MYDRTGMAMGEGSQLPDYRWDQGGVEDAAKAFAVTLTDDDIAYLEEPYIPHRIVGAVDHNLADGVMLLDEKK